MKNIGTTHENLDQKAYLIIKEMINDRRLAPGEKISQEQLAGELGISRTPLISALKYLEKEKLVEAKPRRGFFVRTFDHQEMISIFELREVLEGLAARRAAMTATDRQIDQLRTFFSDFTGKGSITNHRNYCREDRRFHNLSPKSPPGSFCKASFPPTTSSASPINSSLPKVWCALPTKPLASIWPSSMRSATGIRILPKP